MKPKYCYWSVCDDAYGARMEHCVCTARQAGVFKEFHVLCDRPLAGCECYDTYKFEKEHSLFKLHYLKVGMSRLNFDYFVWLDADTVFMKNPVDVLTPLGKSPIHVPLEANLSAWLDARNDPSSTLKESGTEWNLSLPSSDGKFLLGRHELMRQEGVTNQVYVCGSAFWIMHHDAIEMVYDLALGFWHKAKEAGWAADVSAGLGYSMQILCADSAAHLLDNYPNLWQAPRKVRLASHPSMVAA